MLQTSLSFFIVACHFLFTGIECIKVDSDVLDRILQVYNTKLPCASQIVRFDDVVVEKQDSPVYEESTIILLGQMKNGDVRNFSLSATELAPDGFRRTLAEDTGFLYKLHAVYTEVIPKMRDLMNVAKDTSEPLFLDLMDAKNGSYVITAIPERGWSPGSEDMDPNLPELGLALRSLAKWHAMSAVLVEKDQIPLDQFAERLRPIDRVAKYYTMLLGNFADVVRTNWGKKWKQVAQQMKDTAPEVDQKLRSIFNRTNEDNVFKVLNLGEFYWPFMWVTYGITDTYVTNHPIAIKFTSFETAHINTPALDIHNVIYTTPNIRMALKYKDGLIKNEYYPALIGYLSKFGYGGVKPTLSQLVDELHRSELYGILTSIGYFSTVFGNKLDADAVIALEESWKTGEVKINVTSMMMKGFSDATRPVLESAMDSKVFGKRARSEDDDKSGSDSESESD